ncbi:MAG: DMT family transporter [Oscillospiraceae bacterium]|nr:DMT family transporter [Oscillospiraceae bacterium]
MKNKAVSGHLLALLSVLVWGATYVASDYLLQFFTSMQLLTLRYSLGYLVLLAIKPRFLPVSSISQELSILLISLFGVLLYYFLETRAIHYGGATNVSILISTVPMWTLLLLCMTTKNTMNIRHLLGFVAAIGGVVLVVYNGAAIDLSMSASALLFSFGACLCWAIYSMLIDRHKKVDSILLTKRMLGYALLFMLPLTLIFDGVPSLKPLASLTGIGALSLLGVFGSGLCYVWWKKAIEHAGVVNATNYIYLIPFITMAVAIILGWETVSVMGLIGSVLIVVGIILSSKQ